jgi:mono/diheme cytochrome c family protein
MAFARHLCLALLSLSSTGLSAQIQLGEHVFRERCMVCHGLNADGKSELAKLMKPPPANLRASMLSPDQKAVIVRKGGEAVGRSPNMPTWEQELTETELTAVLAYLGSLRAVDHTSGNTSGNTPGHTASGQKQP